MIRGKVELTRRVDGCAGRATSGVDVEDQFLSGQEDLENETLGAKRAIDTIHAAVNGLADVPDVVGGGHNGVAMWRTNMPHASREDRGGDVALLLHVRKHRIDLWRG